MAQISKGIRVGYGAKSGATRPTSYTFLPELTGIPSLGASPSTHQRTTLNDSMHRYIKGLVDVGGNLDFPCIFTKDIIEVVETAKTAQNSSILEWCVEFPLPLGKRMYFTGEISAPFNESVDVDSLVVGTVSIIPTSEILMETANYLIEFNSDGGSVVASQLIAYGGVVVKPADPEKGTDTFDGWYEDIAYTKPVNFLKYKVLGGDILYAKWSV